METLDIQVVLGKRSSYLKFELSHGKRLLIES